MKLQYDIATTFRYIVLDILASTWKFITLRQNRFKYI